jgi:hypothetical protein
VYSHVRRDGLYRKDERKWYVVIDSDGNTL